MQRAHYVNKVGNANQLAGIVKANEIADPGKGGDVGDAVLIAHDPWAFAKLPVEHAE